MGGYREVADLWAAEFKREHDSTSPAKNWGGDDPAPIERPQRYEVMVAHSHPEFAEIAELRKRIDELERQINLLMQICETLAAASQ